MPLVSIIIPVYNAEKTLRRCLDSLVSQTYKNIEVLLIDDGSVDSSSLICREYCDKYEYFKYYYQHNSGPSTARNYGIEQSKGKYVYFVDSDDYVEPEIIEKMVDVAEINSAEMVICNFFIEKPNCKSIPHSYETESQLFIGGECEKLSRNLINDISNKRIPPYSWLRMILRSSLENPRIRYEDGMIRSEDYHFFVRLQFRLHKIYVLNEPLYHYVEVQTSITHRYVPEYWTAVKRIYVDLCKSLPADDDITNRLNIMFIQRTLIALNNVSQVKDFKQFKCEAKEIVYDKMLRDVIAGFDFADGVKEFGAFYILMKLNLHFVVIGRYKAKYNKIKKGRGVS